MSADFNNPTVDDQYTEILPQIRDNQTANAVMFNGITANNIPVNAVQFISGQFNIWNGATWNVQPVSIAGGGTGATNASDARANLGISSDTENDSKFMAQSANGSDIDDKSTFRTEIDTPSNSEAALNSDNLSNLASASTAFNNIKQIASQNQAEAGTDNELIMTPLRVSQAVRISFDDNNVTSGDFTSGELHARKIGDTVTIWGKLFHASDTNPTTAVGFLPLEFRSASIARNTYSISAISPNIRTITASNSGAIEFVFLDSSFSSYNDTDTDWFSISYVIA